MRILQVIHQYPPFSSQGSELYCHHISNYLSGLGHQIGVFHLSNTTPRYPKRLGKRIEAGISLYHCIDAGAYSRLANWPNQFLLNTFRNVLDEFDPDVVHFHNYLSLADNLVGLAKANAKAVTYTLHDFGLICPNEHLLREEGGLCHKNSANFFQDCCPTFIRTRGHGGQRFADLPSLARWRTYALNYPGKHRRFLLNAAVNIAETILGPPETTALVEKKEFFLTATANIFQDVDLFLAPSQFLRDRYVACGIEPNKIIHLRYGMCHIQPVPRPPRRDDRLQFGFIGAFHAHKGVDLLLEAFQGLGDVATLHLHGSSFDSPISSAHFKRSISKNTDGVIVHGRYNNSQIGSILAGLDAVIVPSRWYENSPLTIQEAQIAAVPVITADVGGMAELVQDGVNGRLFRCNDAYDLRRVLVSIINHPEQLQTFQANAPTVPKIEEQTKQLQELYTILLSRGA